MNMHRRLRRHVGRFGRFGRSKLDDIEQATTGLASRAELNRLHGATIAGFGGIRRGGVLRNIRNAPGAF